MQFCFRIIWPPDATNDKQRVRLLAFSEHSAATAWHASAVAAVAGHSNTFTRSPSGPAPSASPPGHSHIRHTSMPAVSPSLAPSSRLTLSHDSGVPESPVPAPMDAPPKNDEAKPAAAAPVERPQPPTLRPVSPASDELMAFHTALDSSWTHVSSGGGESGIGSGGGGGVPHTPQYARSSGRGASAVDRVLSDLWPEVCRIALRVHFQRPIAAVPLLHRWWVAAAACCAPRACIPWNGQHQNRLEQPFRWAPFGCSGIILPQSSV